MPRPKQFDPDQVLDVAMTLFWEKGYEATSVQELVDHMGINRFSLYDTFGSKHELFLASLDRYFDRVVLERLVELETSEEGIPAIRRFFDRWIDLFASPTGWRGCLVTNSAVELAPHDEETATRVSGTLGRMERALHSALVRAREQGDPETDQDLGDLARVLTGAVQGMAVLAKASLDRRGLQGYARVVLSILE